MSHVIKNGARFTVRMKKENCIPRMVVVDASVIEKLADSLEEGRKLYAAGKLVKSYDPSIFVTTHKGVKENYGLSIYSRTCGNGPDVGGSNGKRGNSVRFHYVSEWSPSYASERGSWRIPVRPEKVEELVRTLKFASVVAETVRIASTHDGDLIVSWE